MAGHGASPSPSKLSGSSQRPWEITTQRPFGPCSRHHRHRPESGSGRLAHRVVCWGQADRRGPADSSRIDGRRRESSLPTVTFRLLTVSRSTANTGACSRCRLAGLPREIASRQIEQGGRRSCWCRLGEDGRQVGCRSSSWAIPWTWENGRKRSPRASFRSGDFHGRCR